MIRLLILFFIASTAIAGPTGMMSDEFVGYNTSIWSPYPTNVISTPGVTGEMQLTASAGSDHTIWFATNNALRLTQACANVDFTMQTHLFALPIEVKSFAGLYVEGTNVNENIRFSVMYDTDFKLKLFIASTLAGTSVTERYSIPAFAPNYLKVSRVGDLWTVSYSADNVAWQSLATFTRAIGVTKAGLHVGNTGKPTSSSSPAITAHFDNFIVDGVPAL